MPKDSPPLDRETLVTRLRETAAKLGKQTLTRDEFARATGLRPAALRRFGRFTDCTRAAGLQPYHGAVPLRDDDLLRALRDVFASHQGKVSLELFNKVGRYHVATYRTRWRSWAGALAALVRWLEWQEPRFPHLETIRATALRGHPRAPKTPVPAPVGRPYGRPLNFRTLQHAPVNEQGVVFLFGAMAFELGFMVETVGTGFPDCTAKRRADRTGDIWAAVRIEFEHTSRNFRTHGHDPKACDLIVCWEHNWPECPLEVIELKSAVAAAT